MTKTTLVLLVLLFIPLQAADPTTPAVDVLPDGLTKIEWLPPSLSRRQRVLFEVADKRPPFHALTLRGTRITGPLPADCWANVRLASRIMATAS